MSNAQAIGLQHGLFRSQSTQGQPWQGTATIVDERYNLTVFADYLDVEMEWTIQAGGTPPDSFRNALEIVGNINLVDKSVVVGMITWYNGMILKGKLKTNEVARQEYERVVDRSSDAPPPPRDPVLLEWIRDDNYDISIFPVTFGGTRKVRIRYLIPAFSVNGENAIAYPHAFTDNASVTIRPGVGIQGYRVATAKSRVLFQQRNPVTLDAASYSFTAYGGEYQSRIDYIIPILKDAACGSRFYTAGFSTAAFSGQMLHIATMTGEEALRAAGLAEDFVILWRWNHPKILEKYARQIVEQSQLLTEFLESLESAGKRAALIVDKEGGERVIFRLDRKSGREYQRMIAYLADLSRLAVVDPPSRATPRSGDIAFDVSQAFKEFQDALKAAQELFEANDALKRLLIITAGPRLVNRQIADQTVTWDETIGVSLLRSYFNGSKSSITCASPDDYWPGIDLRQVTAKRHAGLSVFATVGNGVDTARIQVLNATESGSSFCQVTTTQMHLYSSRRMHREIRWSIYRGEALLSAFREAPLVVTLPDGMQYARVIGGSPHLTPLAPQMPSSLAATLGFIDEKYSLVALEEDALPPLLAQRYDRSGVPALDAADIFAAADERADVPVAEWLKVNPPESMAQRVCGWYVLDSIRVVLTVRADWALFDAKGAPEVAIARIAPPQAQTIYPTDPEAYLDYESALAAAQTPSAAAPSPDRIRAFVSNGNLVIGLGGISRDQRQRMTLTLCDPTGRAVRSWTGNEIAGRFCVLAPVGRGGLSRGTYLLHVTAGFERRVVRIAIR